MLSVFTCPLTEPVIRPLGISYEPYPEKFENLFGIVGKQAPLTPVARELFEESVKFEYPLPENVELNIFE